MALQKPFPSTHSSLSLKYSNLDIAIANYWILFYEMSKMVKVFVFVSASRMSRFLKFEFFNLSSVSIFKLLKASFEILMNWQSFIIKVLSCGINEKVWLCRALHYLVPLRSNMTKFGKIGAWEGFLSKLIGL